MRGSLDKIVPKESVHIQENKEDQFEIDGYGYLGLVFANQQHIINIIKILKKLKLLILNFGFF